MPCVCGGKKVPTKKVPPKKVPAKKVPPVKDSKRSQRLSKRATKKATRNNPYAKGCKCT